MNVYNRFILNISYQSDSLREFTQKTPIPQFPYPPAPFREPHSKSTLQKSRDQILTAASLKYSVVNYFTSTFVTLFP